MKKSMNSTVAIDILEQTHKLLPLYDCYFLADKAYDAKAIYNHICDTYNSNCFIPINQRNTKNTKLLPSGHPICEAGLTMHKDGKSYDKNRVRQKFSCPLKSSSTKKCPCKNSRFYKSKKNRGCTKCTTLPSDYRLTIDRNDRFFKSTYSLCTECERYNSRFKHTGQERMWIRNINSVKNLNTIAHISLLAIAITTIVTNSSQSYRKIKTTKRIF